MTCVIKSRCYHKYGETIHAPKRDILFAYQATPIGIDFSNGPVRYFMEAGYDASGIFKIGICCKLHRGSRKQKYFSCDM